MIQHIQGMKWGLCSLGNRRLHIETAGEPATHEDIARRQDAEILERLARVKEWVETKQAAEEAEAAGNKEEAHTLKARAASIERRLKAEDNTPKADTASR